MPAPCARPTGRFISGLRGTGPRTAGVRYVVLATVFTGEATSECAVARGLLSRTIPQRNAEHAESNNVREPVREAKNSWVHG